MSNASLHLRRRSQWLSRWRAFRVMLDGQCVGKLKNGAASVYEIAPGEHELVLSIDWVSSEPVLFHCEAGEAVHLVCGHATPTWRAAFAPHTLVSTIEIMPDDAEPGAEEQTHGA